MNRFNRWLVIAQLLALIALMPVIAVLVLFFLPGVAALLNNIARELTNGAYGLIPQAIGVGGAVGVFVIAVALLFWELRHSSRRRFRAQSAEGEVEVAGEAIVQRLEQSLAGLEDITRVKPRVAAGKGNGVDVTLELETMPAMNVPHKAQQVISVVKQVMEQDLGLTVGKLRVQLGAVRQSAPKKAKSNDRDNNSSASRA